MSITQKQWEELNRFHKKMQEYSGLKGKFASKMLLKLRPKWKGGGGNQSRAANEDITNDVVEYSNEMRHTATQGNNQLVLNRQDVHVDLARVDRTLAIALFGSNEVDRNAAIRAILLPQQIHNYGGLLVRLLNLGMIIWGTYTTWDLFDNISGVSRAILNTIQIPPSPSPPATSWANGFGLLGRGPAPVPAPALPAPPQGYMSWMFSWVMGGGEAFAHRSRLVLAWFADLLNELVGAGQLGVTIAVFILLTIAALLIISMYENGVQLWFGLGGIDTRRNAAALPAHQPVARETSDTSLQRLRNSTTGNLPRRLMGPRNRGKSRSAQNRTSKKMKKRRKKKAAFQSNIGRGNFRFPPSPPPGASGTPVGGKRRKTKRRKIKRKKRKTKRRKKRKTKRRR